MSNTMQETYERSTIFSSHESPSKPRNLNELLAYQDWRFVEAAYELLLARKPDKDGYEFYLSRIRGGARKIQILKEISRSPEAASRGTNIKGLRKTMLMEHIGSLPVIGSIVRRLLSLEGNSKLEVRLRILEQKNSILRDVVAAIGSPQPASETRLSQVPQLLGDLSEQLTPLSDTQGLKTNYEGLECIVSQSEIHLGGNIREGDPFTFSPRVWDYLLSRFAVNSVLDIGSGLGYAASYFAGKGKHVIAAEGLRENVEKAFYPTVHFDLEKGPIRCVVDLVHCQEVVEHIEEKYVDNLLMSLACGRVILISHATPGQGGYHHVNEKPAQYWIDHLARYKCTLIQEDTDRIRKLAKEDCATYLGRTGMVFTNQAR